MPQDLYSIPKKSAEVYLAADDGALIYDDGDDHYLMVRFGDALTKIASNLANLLNISKNSGALTKIDKS